MSDGRDPPTRVLLETDWTVLDYEVPVPPLFVAITPEGKAEFVRRMGPTPDDAAWRAKHSDAAITVWAKSIEVAHRVAGEMTGLQRRGRSEDATFAPATGEVMEGVRVEYATRGDSGE